ncbi:MAG: glycosyltransferase family 4 protein [Candidatus Pacebacteria bacterium]|nr:glycosyltransferase family 4 protein [Candidatus Paceibacterota bacterium]
MRIAIVIWQIVTNGGSVRQALELANSLQRLGHDVELVTYAFSKLHCYPELTKSLKIYCADSISMSQFFYNPSASIFVRIFGFFYNMFVAHIHTSAIKEKLLERNSFKQFDVVNYHDNGVIQLAKYFPRSKNIWMMNDPSSFIDTKEKDASVYAKTSLISILAYLESRYINKLLRSIDRIIVLDERNKSIVCKYYSREAHIVRSGVALCTTNKFSFRNKKNQVLRIMSTNIFFRHRRYEDLIEAIKIIVLRKNHPQFHVYIIGDPISDLGYYHEIRFSVSKYRLEKYITFLGKVSESELNEQYERADIFVFPNHNQTWGLSVFEAMLHGCACIVSKTAGAHEVLKDGQNVLLIQPKKPLDLAEKLLLLLRSTTLRKSLAKEGFQFVQKNISWDKYAKDMTVIFS